jgi:hypothetical protein
MPENHHIIHLTEGIYKNSCQTPTGFSNIENGCEEGRGKYDIGSLKLNKSPVQNSLFEATFN